MWYNLTECSQHHNGCSLIIFSYCLGFIGLERQKIDRKIMNFSYPSILTYVSGAQKNFLIETVLLSTHNICFG